MALVIALITVFGGLQHAQGSLLAKTLQAQLKPDNATDSGKLGRLRGAGVSQLPNSTALHEAVQGSRVKGMPCQCDAGQPTWVQCTRTIPKCVFIDLGAANGNTLQDFVNGKYGPVAQCPSGGQWQATLVEANPRFTAELKQVEVNYAGAVTAAAASAAYMCEAQTTFYLDTQSHEHNYWGSSMSPNHVDTQKSGHQAVTVPTVNILKLLYEQTIPGDYVMLKMDIEGAEWDVLPCLSQAPVAALVDRLLVELHPMSWGNAGTDQATMNGALATLRAKGVDIPNSYHSTTF